MGRPALEAFIELDRTLSPLKRTRIIKSLLSEGATQARKIGYGEIHAPTEDSNFHEFLVGLGFNRDDRYHAWLNIAGPGA